MQQIGRQMNKIKIGWKPKKFGEIVDIRNGRNQQQVLSENGQYPILGSAGNLMGYATDYICESGTTIIGRKGNISKPLFINERFWNVDTAFGFYPKRLDELDNRFLYYLCLNIDFESLNRGTTIPSLVKSELQRIPLNVPCFSEQQCIVAILDEAFAAIDKAKTNAERNLKNARELFESSLDSIFNSKEVGWRKETLGRVAEHSLGKMLDKNKNKGVPHKYLRNQSVRWFEFDLSDLGEMLFLESEVNKYTAVKGDVLVCEGGYPGRAAIWDEDYAIYFQKALHRVRFHKTVYNKLFVYYLFFLDKTDRLKSHFSGTGIQHFTGQALNRLVVPLPPEDKAEAIIKRLDLLLAETQRLGTVYERKLARLDELKKSLLQKAFSGELTASKPIAKVLELPIKYTTISAIDLQAGIVAYALQRHLEANKANTFKHVKAEKIVHLAEQILNIDLERNPVKDAAGPNDFPHAKKVEFRAEKVGYFNVHKTEIGYEPGNQIQSIINKTQTVLETRVDKLKWLVDLLVPMTTQQAEIIATVYAAWNNLLLNKLNITDEAIVAEARENWHPDKLKIEREKFFNAIGWMNKVGLVPTGNGKQVSAKATK